ncbi:MAG TPA: hypothetical protein VH518_20685 [Tepidisphaeraceae bacterium]|jgi:hypothetical protein
MKAERRHELQTNSLAQFLNDLPIYLRIHANKLLIGVIILCLLFMLVRYRMNAAEDTQRNMKLSLGSARIGIDQVHSVERMGVKDPSEQVRQLKSLAASVNSALDQVIANTTDPAVLAEAYAARGDLYWALANVKPLPGAATQPALAMPETPQQYFGRAEEHYLRVLKDYPTQPTAKVTALLGLAAIEENRHNWDKAAGYYKQVQDDPTAANVFKRLADQRTRMLSELRTPIYLGAFSSTQPTTAPTTAPTAESTTQPSPAAAPAVAVPTTQPK